jgi:hypothetical protein
MLENITEHILEFGAMMLALFGTRCSFCINLRKFCITIITVIIIAVILEPVYKKIKKAVKVNKK